MSQLSEQWKILNRMITQNHEVEQIILPTIEERYATFALDYDKPNLTVWVQDGSIITVQRS